MINIDYSNKKIRVETKNISNMFETPISLSITSHVSGKEIWGTKLNDNCWAEFPNNEMHDVVLKDSNGNLILHKKWDVMNDGSYIYKSLYFYCKKILESGRKPKGIAIGTHDGLFGEWVPSVIDNITDAILVEASLPQYNKLEEVYDSLENVKLVNSIITSHGNPVEFFEGGLGYTNSVVERVIKGWEKEEINSSIKESLSFDDLLSLLSDEKQIDWLHTDIEGYDIKLLLSISPDKLPKLIIFEYENSEDSENEEIKKFLTNCGYHLEYLKVSCLAIKN
jgi:hypothetical protein